MHLHDELRLLGKWTESRFPMGPIRKFPSFQYKKTCHLHSLACGNVACRLYTSTRPTSTTTHIAPKFLKKRIYVCVLGMYEWLHSHFKWETYILDFRALRKLLDSTSTFNRKSYICLVGRMIGKKTIYTMYFVEGSYDYAKSICNWKVIPFYRCNLIQTNKLYYSWNRINQCFEGFHF